MLVGQPAIFNVSHILVLVSGATTLRIQELDPLDPEGVEVFASGFVGAEGALQAAVRRFAGVRFAQVGLVHQVNVEVVEQQLVYHRLLRQRLVPVQHLVFGGVDVGDVDVAFGGARCRKVDTCCIFLDPIRSSVVLN